MTTNAELALLSLLSEKPHHGYDLERIIEERGMREWTEIGFSSIYYLLKKLEQATRIESHLEETGQGPARKVYRITADGREHLREAVLEALATPQRCYTPLLLGISNLPCVSAAEAIDALRHYVETLDEQVEHVKAHWEAQKPLPHFVEALFTYSITMAQTECEWIEAFIQQIETEASDGEN